MSTAACFCICRRMSVELMTVVFRSADSTGAYLWCCLHNFSNVLMILHAFSALLCCICRCILAKLFLRWICVISACVLTRQIIRLQRTMSLCFLAMKSNMSCFRSLKSSHLFKAALAFSWSASWYCSLRFFAFWVLIDCTADDSARCCSFRKWY